MGHGGAWIVEGKGAEAFLDIDGTKVWSIKRQLQDPALLRLRDVVNEAGAQAPLSLKQP